ncbi:MAG: SMC-Scp complex subunit ScpB [Candidatus Latescibacterota bacterium]|nr:MAG: SMC-Scp complex subunit ScpB [Candidatus Latescibacterota bacterium]
MAPDNLEDIIIALLFASDEPLSVRKMSAVVDDTPVEAIHGALASIGERFGGDGSVIQLEQVAGGYQFSTNTAYSDYIARMYRGRRKQRLSKASMETLAIIAYKQPVTRADIENLRGVGCGGVITTLMERSLIRIVGKAKVLGSPFLYGTTQEFLEYLGLNSLKDLPSMEDLEALLEQEVAAGGEFEPAEPPHMLGEEPDSSMPDSDESVVETSSEQTVANDQESSVPSATDTTNDGAPPEKAAGSPHIDDREPK